MGKLFIVGIGPGSMEHMTQRALEVLRSADVIVGYETYIALLGDLVSGKEVISSGMGAEMDRARIAVERASSGSDVALVSSGDPGIYAMGSAVLEHLESEGLDLELEIVPGVTAANAAAALLGSPLGHDHAIVSLSDLLTPWKEIERRLEHAARADLAIVLYNPTSKGREKQLRRAVGLLLEHRLPDTPVGIVRNAMREGESATITTLRDVLKHNVDMLTTIIIGNSTTRVHNGRMYTPRGYDLRKCEVKQ